MIMLFLTTVLCYYPVMYIRRYSNPYNIDYTSYNEDSTSKNILKKNILYNENNTLKNSLYNGTVKNKLSHSKNNKINNSNKIYNDDYNTDILIEDSDSYKAELNKDEAIKKGKGIIKNIMSSITITKVLVFMLMALIFIGLGYQIRKSEEHSNYVRLPTS
ncbi:hypothetical protein SLOPH_1026 [Spraguea lophii 42_110]|uniref:Uncharacterized protein n=1 Tax=Spraguea lophii (strain 42_110) TaxID=1358809 RepID=S7WE20_SPRLO|nr:hypothetical protein SLOPH_1026 [Spraguea lophii 42_110]